MPSPSRQPPMRVDFSYAFATPHRLTAALPDSSHKTLLDLQGDFLRMAWADDDLRDKPLAAMVLPRTAWEVRLTAELDGKPLTLRDWRRAEGWLPVLEAQFGAGNEKSRRREASGETTGIAIAVAAGPTACMMRLTAANHDRRFRRLAFICEKPGGWSGINPAWVQSEWDADVLLAGWTDRADRVLVLGVGGQRTTAPQPTALRMEWDLEPGQTRTAWLIRPYRAFHDEAPGLRRRNWEKQFAAAKAAWRRLIGRAARVVIPDAAVENAFKAGVADCFVMREPVADGSVVACPGTEGIARPNPFEPLIASVLFDQLALHEEAAGNSQMLLRQQGADGNWADPRGWAHWMWGASGFKSWAAIEHYRLSGDTASLAAVFPRMLASSRWQETQRAKTRVQANGERPLTYGLLPRGMGDGGLRGEDGSFYGVFLPHNILAVYADAMTLEAARLLGKTRHLPELRSIHRAAQRDLLAALERGAIAEPGYRWIPGVPGHTCGSSFGALYAAFPCRILPPDHPLITGTLRKMESRLSPGGVPVGIGWMKDGLWVAMALDNLAGVLLRRGDGGAAARYLYATLNHGTPLYTWCEERGQEPGATECTGDRQHLWTPLVVARYLRDALALEDGDTLHLARGTARQWLAGGQKLGARGLATHFGSVSYEMSYDAKNSSVHGTVQLDGSAKRVVLHLRLPHGGKVKSVRASIDAHANAEGSAIEWSDFSGKATFQAVMLPCG